MPKNQLIKLVLVFDQREWLKNYPKHGQPRQKTIKEAIQRHREEEFPQRICQKSAKELKTS